MWKIDELMLSLADLVEAAPGELWDGKTSILCNFKDIAKYSVWLDLAVAASLKLYNAHDNVYVMGSVRLSFAKDLRSFTIRRRGDDYIDTGIQVGYDIRHNKKRRA